MQLVRLVSLGRHSVANTHTHTHSLNSRAPLPTDWTRTSTQSLTPRCVSLWRLQTFVHANQLQLQRESRNRGRRQWSKTAELPFLVMCICVHLSVWFLGSFSAGEAIVAVDNLLIAHWWHSGGSGFGLRVVLYFFWALAIKEIELCSLPNWLRCCLVFETRRCTALCDVYSSAATAAAPSASCVTRKNRLQHDGKLAVDLTFGTLVKKCYSKFKFI